MCGSGYIKIKNRVGRQGFYFILYIFIPPFHRRGVYCFTSVRPSVRPKIFFITFFSATIDGRNLIFGHKLHIHVGTPYRGKRSWTRHIPTSCLRGGIISEHQLTVHLVFTLILWERHCDFNGAYCKMAKKSLGVEAKNQGRQGNRNHTYFFIWPQEY